MTRVEAIARLRAHEAALRAMGIERLSLFGSTARGDAKASSDVDLAAIIDFEAVRKLGPFGFFGIEDRVAEMIGVSVDLVVEPEAQHPRLQAEIDRDRVHVF